MAVRIYTIPLQPLLFIVCPLRQGGVRLTHKFVDKLLTTDLLNDVLKEEKPVKTI